MRVEVEDLTPESEKAELEVTDAIKQVYARLGPVDYAKFNISPETLERYAKYATKGPEEYPQEEAVYVGQFCKGKR